MYTTHHHMNPVSRISQHKTLKNSRVGHGLISQKNAFNIQRWGVFLEIPKLEPQHLIESGTYNIIHGKGAALIQVAALNRSFTVNSPK